MLTLWLLALCVAGAAALSAVFRHQWCPLGCLARQPKAYGDDAISPDYDPLLPRLSPIVYCYTGTSPDLQETLHALAAARTSVEVNDALPGAALEWMFTILDDAQQFVALCKGHVDLSAIMVCNLASLVVGLQRFAESEPIAQFITDCFRAKVAGDLLRLKHEIEKRVPVYDVVYNRIESTTLQECILTHMELQARVLRATPGYEAPVKLLSEIDDTLFAVDHDRLYPELTVYPGVQQFAKEVLSDNSYRRHDGKVSLDTRDQRQVFLTLRTEMWRRRADEELVSSGFDHYTLMTGTMNEVLGGADASFHHKLQNIRRYKRIFGDCDFVFVGHNGGSDITLAEELLRHPQRYSVSIVLLHDVMRQQSSSYHNGKNSSAIRFFRTYVGAAVQLCELELIGLDAAMRVARAAVAAFRAVPFERAELQDAAALDLATELADLLDVLTPSEVSAIAALTPRAVLRFLANRLPMETEHGLLIV